MVLRPWAGGREAEGLLELQLGGSWSAEWSLCPEGQREGRAQLDRVWAWGGRGVGTHPTLLP